MNALDALQKRNSAPRLAGTVTPDQLNEILTAGLRAPDHGQLRPWRIVVVEGNARSRLGALFAQARLTRDPNQPREQLEKLKAKPFRAPLVIVVAAHITEHPRVPKVEQILSAGAVVQNMLIAAHALGLGAMWRTGEVAYDPIVIKGLGFDETDQIVGFVYLGEIDGKQKNVPSMDLKDFVRRW